MPSSRDDVKLRHTRYGRRDAGATVESSFRSCLALLKLTLEFRLGLAKSHLSSAGAAAIAYPLAWYGADRNTPGGYLDTVLFTSGPTLSDIKAGCQYPQARGRRTSALAEFALEPRRSGGIVSNT